MPSVPRTPGPWTPPSFIYTAPFDPTAAPVSLPLAASSLVSSSTLALTAKTQIPLAASSLLTSPTLALKARPAIPLDAASLIFTDGLSLTAPSVGGGASTNYDRLLRQLG